jgi:hypothetical protein
MSIDAWIREQCSAAVVGPRLRAEGWTMTDEEVEALPREETAARLAEWGEEFARNVARLGGLHVGQGEHGDQFWVAGPPGVARAELARVPRRP